jgi:Domain of unknown function (DUF4395)
MTSRQSEIVPEGGDGFGEWMRANLSTQGYRMPNAERRRLWLGLRFPTGLCLALVVTALALESPVMLLVLSGIGLFAGFTSRHPFDYLWNHGVRHLFDAPALPPNPRRRRHSFKLATAWLLAVAVLFAVGLDTGALVLGSVLVAVCGLVTVTNFCVPSTLFAWWEERRPTTTVST